MALPKGSHPRTRASVRLSEELSKHGAAAATGRATEYTLRSTSQTAVCRSLRPTTTQLKKTCSQESLPARFTRSSASQRCAVQTPKPTSATALAGAAWKSLPETGPAAINTTSNPTASSASYEENTKIVDPAEDGRKQRLPASRRYRGPAQSTRDRVDDTLDSSADSDAHQKLDYQYTTKMRTSNSSTATTASDGSSNSEANSCINVAGTTLSVESHSPAITSVQSAGSLPAFCDEACPSSQQQLQISQTLQNHVAQGQKPALQRQQLSVPHQALAEIGEPRDCVRQEHSPPFKGGERIAAALSRSSNDATARSGTARSGACSPADSLRGSGQDERTSVPIPGEPEAPSSWEHSNRALSAREQAKQLLTLLKTLQGRFAVNRSALRSPSPSEEKLPFSPRGADPDNLKAGSHPEDLLFSRVRTENETSGGVAGRQRHGMYCDKGIGDVSDARGASRQSSLSGGAAQKLALCALARRENISEATLNLQQLGEEQDLRCKPQPDTRCLAAPANARMAASVLPAGSGITDLSASLLSNTDFDGTFGKTENAQAPYTTTVLAGKGSGDRESVCSGKERTQNVHAPSYNVKEGSCAGCLNEEEAVDGDNMQESSVEEGDSDSNSLSPRGGNDVGEAKRLLLVRQARMFPAVRGVYFDTRSGNLSWRCSWKVDGKKRSRSWSVLKFGMEGARAHAIAERLRQHSKACHTDDVARDFLRTFAAEKGDRTYRRGHDFTLPPTPNGSTIDDAGGSAQLQKSGGPSCLTQGMADEAAASTAGISYSDSGKQAVPAPSNVNYGMSATQQTLSGDTQLFSTPQMPAPTGTEELNMNEISSRGEPALSPSDASSCLKGSDGLTVAFSGQQQQQEQQRMLNASGVLAASLSSRPAYDMHTSQQSKGPSQSASSVSGARPLPAAGEKPTYVSNTTPRYTSFSGLAPSVVCQPGREGFPVFPVEDETRCCWPDPPPAGAVLSAENPRFSASSRAGCVSASFLSANDAKEDGASIAGFVPQGEHCRHSRTEQSCAETVSPWGDTVSSCPEVVCAKRRKVFRDTVFLSPGSLPCSENASSSPFLPAPETKLHVPDEGEGAEGKKKRVNGQESGRQSPPASQEEEEAICCPSHEAISGEPCVTEAPAGKGRKCHTQSMPVSQEGGQAIFRPSREAISGAPFVAEARAALLTPVTMISAAAAEEPRRGGAAAAEGPDRGSPDVPVKMQQPVAQAAVVAEESHAVSLQKEVQGEERELPTKRPVPYGGRKVRDKGDDVLGTAAGDQEEDRSVSEKATALTGSTVIAGRPASSEYVADPTAVAGQCVSSKYATGTPLLTLNPGETPMAAPPGAGESGKRVIMSLSAVSAAALAARMSEVAGGDGGENIGRPTAENSALTFVSRTRKDDHSNMPRASTATAQECFGAVHGEGRAGRDLAPVGCRDDALNNLELEEQCSTWWCFGVDETPVAERLPQGEASSSTASKIRWSGPAAAGTTVSLESHGDTLRAAHYEDTPTTAPSPTPEDLPAEAVSVLSGGTVLLGKEKSVGTSTEATRDDTNEGTCPGRSPSAAPWVKTREVTSVEEITSRRSKHKIFGTCQERQEDRAAHEAKTREEDGGRTSAAKVADEEQGGVVGKNCSSANTGISLTGGGSLQSRINTAAEACTCFSMGNSDRRRSSRGSTAGEKAMLGRTALVEALLKLRECLTELLQLSPRGTSPERHRDDHAENAARASPRILLFPSASRHCNPPDNTTHKDASRPPTGVVYVHREYEKEPSTAAWCLQCFDELLETLDLRRTNGSCQNGVGGEEKMECSKADEAEATAHDREEEKVGCQEGEETPCTGGGVKALEKTIMLLLSGLLEGGLLPSSVSMLSPYKSRALLAAIITCFSNWKHQQAS